MYKVIEDSAKRFEIVFDNSNERPEFRPVASQGEYIEMGTGGESAAIAISIVFRRSSDNSLTDNLFVFENIAGDPTFPGPHAEGDVLEFNQSNFSKDGDGLLAGFTSTYLKVTVGPTRENPFTACLVLSACK